MEIEEVKALSADIMGNLGDQGYISNKLADFVSAYAEESQKRLLAEEEVERLSTANDKLREDNMKLFLRATSPISEQSSSTQTNKETDIDPIDALFKDGGINWA